jgi:RimJ/RimL family protein N-acetyltransferase
VPELVRHRDFAIAQFGDPAVVPWHFPAAASDPGGPRSEAQIDEMLERWRRQLEERGFTWWPWRERDSGELVCMVGLNLATVEGEPMVEVAWSVAPRRWGEGLAAEAAAASLAWGFERCGLSEIVSFTMVENRRSRKVMEKLGMRYTRDFEHHGLPHVLYTLTP